MLSSHVGLVSNPVSLAVVADRLAQDPASWRPFDWGTLPEGPFRGPSAARCGRVTRMTDDLPLVPAAEDLSQRDAAFVARLIPFLRLAMRGWFRSEVTGMEHVPDGGALVVSNHSGGLLAMDVPILAVSFTDHFGPDRPFYVLAHDLLFLANAGAVLPPGRLPARAPGERRGGAPVGRRDHRLPRW